SCAVVACQAGRADCNLRGDDGCEADLLTPQTCGKCTTSCPSTTPFCADDGTAIRCLAACPHGQTACGKSCVDQLMTAVEHCGNCETKCITGAPNTDPVCTNGKCGTKCRAGQDPCDPNDPTKGCGSLKTFYQDQDHDTYGGSQTVAACSKPP